MKTEHLWFPHDPVDLNEWDLNAIRTRWRRDLELLQHLDAPESLSSRLCDTRLLATYPESDSATPGDSRRELQRSERRFFRNLLLRPVTRLIPQTLRRLLAQAAAILRG